MTMNRKVAAGGIAAALAVTGIAATTAGAAWAGGSLSPTATTQAAATTAPNDGVETNDGADAAARDAMVERITEALAGLVDDGTITEDQASAVAEELASSRPMRGGPPGGGPLRGGPYQGTPRHDGVGAMMMEGARVGVEAAAEALGLDEDALRTALRDGSTLADVAEEQGVAVDDLVAALVAAAEEHLSEAVADGRITQERADELAATLPEHMAERVAQTWEPRGPGGHRGGPLGGHLGGHLGNQGGRFGMTEGSTD